jgi:hypothetical protein
MIMPYIDLDYYNKDFGGIMPKDPTTLNTDIKKASEMVDFLTGYKITDLLLMHTDIQRMVKLATAKMAEFYVMNGGYEKTITSNGKVQSASIGSFNYSRGSAPGDASLKVNAPNEVITILSSTGLMYTGVDTLWR